jgi:hypothetical protein
MWPFARKETVAESFRRELNQLQTRVQQLELDNGERQLAVLSACEKTLHQLRAREVKRKENGEPEAPQTPDLPFVQVRPFPNTRRGF